MKREELFENQTVQFKRKLFGGYYPRDVDTYIDVLQTKYRDLEKQHNESRQEYYKEKEQLEQELEVLRDEISKQDTQIEHLKEALEKEKAEKKGLLYHQKESPKPVALEDFMKKQRMFMENLDKMMVKMTTKIEKRLEMDEFLLERYTKQKDLEKTLLNIRKDLHKLQKLSEDEGIQKEYPFLQKNMKNILG